MFFLNKAGARQLTYCKYIFNGLLQSNAGFLWNLDESWASYMWFKVPAKTWGPSEKDMPLSRNSMIWAQMTHVYSVFSSGEGHDVSMAITSHTS